MKAFGLRIFLILIFIVSCYKEEVVFNSKTDCSLELPTILKINGKECCYDHVENSLRFPIDNSVVYEFTPLIEFQKYSVVYFQGERLKNNTVNSLGTIEINKEYEIIIETNHVRKKLWLTFTNLPIVQIITPNTIYDEPKTIARIIINYKEPDKHSDNYYIGVEYRGGTSQTYPKKSYGFSLQGSMSADDKISDSLFDMKQNNDWILDAMWIDKTRLRNKTSFEIWKKFDGENHYGISGEFVELYINNEMQGLYCLNENINPEFINLNNNQAVLYKATSWEDEDRASCFETHPGKPPQNYYWDGWEQKYPEPDIRINWQPLYELRQFVVTSDDEVFTSQISALINIENFRDYYIFLNLVSAMDNTGKNTFLIKKNKEDKVCVIPWDIDASWGLFWDGSHLDYTAILSNNLFDRLIETNTCDFKNRLKQRWISLRGNILSDIELKRIFEDNFAVINRTDIIANENRKWGCNIQITREQEYLLDWLENRTNFLDIYFNSL